MQQDENGLSFLGVVVVFVCCFRWVPRFRRRVCLGLLVLVGYLGWGQFQPNSTVPVRVCVCVFTITQTMKMLVVPVVRFFLELLPIFCYCYHSTVVLISWEASNGESKSPSSFIIMVSSVEKGSWRSCSEKYSKIREGAFKVPGLECCLGPSPYQVCIGQSVSATTTTYFHAEDANSII